MASDESKLFQKIFCFAVIFDPFNSYVNYSNKNMYKESIPVDTSSSCVNAETEKMTIVPGIFA